MRTPWIAALLFLAFPAFGATDKEYLTEVARATWRSIDRMVEPGTGLPHDTVNRVWLDLFPQFAPLRFLERSVTTSSSAAILNIAPCTDPECGHRGSYGLRAIYTMPPGTFGSYSLQQEQGTVKVDVSGARWLELSARGLAGGERFEIVLWSNCGGGFPGRPDSGLISVTTQWQRFRLDLREYATLVDLASLCRVSIGFNDAIHPGGTLYFDDLVFVAEDGSRVQVAQDEETSTTNIGLYLASVVAARDLGIITPAEALQRLTTSITSIERFEKWHGFPQTHNHPVSLSPFAGDRCLSFVDNGYLAAGLTVVRHGLPQLASRSGALLDAMEWEWTYDPARGLPYGCRFPDDSFTPGFYYDFYAADSRFAHAFAIGDGGIPPASWTNLMRAPEPGQCISAPHREPGWDGGGMFMYMLPWIFLDEQATPIAVAARAFIEDQICFAGLIGAPAWGWSATVPPVGTGYCGYLCDRTDYVVPHASMLAAELVANPKLRANLGALEGMGARPLAHDGTTSVDFGFVSSVSLVNGEVSPVYLVLDQAMAFLALSNKLTAGSVRRSVCLDPVATGIRNRLPEFSGSCRPPRTRSVRH